MHVEVGDGIATTNCGDVFLAVWQSPSRVERIRWLGERVDALIEAEHEVICCQFILSTSSPPDAPARRESAVLMQRTGPSMRRFISVPVGDDMWMSIVRTILRGMAIVLRQPVRNTIVANAPQALDHIADAAGPRTPERSELAGAIRAVCSALDIDPNLLGRF